MGLAATNRRSAARPGALRLILGRGFGDSAAAISIAPASPTPIGTHRGVGGVWLENRYPGAACDVPSHLYSFSFAPGRWSRHFADSREIHAYLKEVATARGVVPHIRFGLEVKVARFDEERHEWEITVVDPTGAEQRLRAAILISGVGAFNKPRMPSVPGLDRFKGPSVHTARYPDEGLDLAGKKSFGGNGARRCRSARHADESPA